MANLQDLKIRIRSVKSTQKITQAMKMVAAAKLRKARQRAENSRAYAQRLATMLAKVGQSAESDSILLNGTGKQDKYLLVAVTGNRGLCGSFNSSTVKAVSKRAEELRNEGKKFGIYCIGRKGYETLKIFYPNEILGSFKTDKKTDSDNYDTAWEIHRCLVDIFNSDNYDICEIFYNLFVSVISQKPTKMQLIPINNAKDVQGDNDNDTMDTNNDKGDGEIVDIYSYESDEKLIMEKLLPQNLTMQIFQSLLESAAGEQGARMTAMDNATRNAGDMIDRLTLQYNRTRQAAVTRELIEIISGAEAV